MAATAVFLFLAFTTENKTAVDGMKSMDFPKIILVLQLVLLVLLVIADFAAAKKLAGNPGDEDSEDGKEPFMDKRITVSIAAILIYILLWNVVGFCCSSFLFFSFESQLLDDRQKFWKTLALGVGITVLIYLVFGVGFKVDFPEPILEMAGL